MIPDFQKLMLPVLKCAQNEVVNTKQAINTLAEEFGLTAEEREELVPSGMQPVFDNRVGWAKTYLKQAGLLKYPKRSYFIATEEGRKVLAKLPARIDRTFLQQYGTFQEFEGRKNTRKKTENESSEPASESLTPDERLRIAHKEINDSLAAELLSRVRSASPQFFENLIVRLLEAMGYGGTSENPGHALGRSGDNGVDGVIDQDALGVDQIYLQAKRYAESNSIGAGDIRNFFGALNLKKAQKGIFFTTSNFSLSAIQTAKDLGMRIVLIDGPKLAELMIRYGIGCRDEDTLYLKKVDDEFFETEV